MRSQLAALAVLACVACHHHSATSSVDGATPTGDGAPLRDGPRVVDAPGVGDAAACWPDPSPCGSCSSSQYCYQIYAGVAPTNGCNTAPVGCGTTVDCACVLAALQADNACGGGGLSCSSCSGTVTAICSKP